VILVRRSVRNQVLRELVEQSSSLSVKILSMPYCNIAGKECPVKWGVMSLRNGIPVEEVEQSERGRQFASDPELCKRLADLVEHLIKIGDCSKGPDIDPAGEDTHYALCQHELLSEITDVTDTAFDILITIAQNPGET